MKRFRLVIILAVVALFAAACGGNSGKPDSVPDDAVAVVGGDTISKERYNEVLDQAKRSYKAQRKAFPKAGTQAYSTLRAQIIQFLVERSEYEQTAKDENVEVSDKDVDDRLEQVKKQYFVNPTGSKPATEAQVEKRYQQQLKAQGLTDADVRDGLRYQLIRSKLYDKVTKDIEVSDDDAKKYYDDHKEQYQQPALPESRDVRHILVKQKAKAQAIYAQLKGGADFAKLALKESIDPSKTSGGRLTVCKEQAVSCIKTVPPFERVSFALKNNEISKPVKTRFGWHVIQALGPVKKAKKAQPIPFDQVKAAIKQQLIQQKKQDEMTKWWNDAKKDFDKKTAYQTGYAPPASATQTTTTG
ncbi:MAG TPA: peptidyl-prolyl cis-trans isomerase [Gaiellaceae bacterium]|jgi:foldase protein PrsA|nr:peptidyl-prolyl cis-trans isomerase [Gaiellaceae bacterium]